MLAGESWLGMFTHCTIPNLARRRAAGQRRVTQKVGMKRLDILYRVRRQQRLHGRNACQACLAYYRCSRHQSVLRGTNNEHVCWCDITNEQPNNVPDMYVFI